MSIVNLSIRQKQIFQLLLGSENYITSNEIAQKINISIRTIKADISIIKGAIKHRNCDYVFESVPSKGYRIKNHNTSTEPAENTNYFYSVNKYLHDDMRQAKIFWDILNYKDSIPIKKLTDTYYISRATLYKDFKAISKDLSNYDCTLVYQPYLGAKINGSEINIRFVIQNKSLLNMEMFKNEYDYCFKNYSFSKSNLLDFVDSFSIGQISDFELSNLFHHLLTLLMRCEYEKYIPTGVLNYKTFVNEFEIQRVYDYFYLHKPDFLTIPREEVIYFLLLIKGCTLGYCNQEVLAITNQSLEALSCQLHINFNTSLRSANLSKYMYSLLIRSYNNFKQNTVLLDEIKNKSSLSFDISCCFVQILENTLNIEISKSEISYISYYFLDIRETLNPYYIPNKILLVSYRGAMMCQNLLMELRTNFSFHQFEVCELYELSSKVEKTNYSFIITDVAISLGDTVPVIVISYFLDSKDFYLIRMQLRRIINTTLDEYFDKQITTHLTNKMDFLMSIATTRDEYHNIWQRENRITYQIGKGVLLYLYNTTSKTTMYYSEKGMLWNKEVIHYIFVINVIECNSFIDYYKISELFLKKIAD